LATTLLVGADTAAVVLVLTYVFIYSMTLGPIAFQIVSQIVPALGSDIVFSLNALVTFAIGVTFLVLVDSRIGVAGAFYLYAGFAVLAAIYCLVGLPETTNKTFDEILAYFTMKPKMYETRHVARPNLEIEVQNNKIPSSDETQDPQITSLREVNVENRPPTAITIPSLNAP